MRTVDQPLPFECDRMLMIDPAFAQVQRLMKNIHTRLRGSSLMSDKI